MGERKTKAREKQGKVVGRGAHPNSRRALEKTQFKPGESGNPAGLPSGTKQRSTILNKWLSVETELLNPITKLKQKGTVEDEVILALITKARKGDVPAVKEILDSVYGKIPNKDEITGKDGESLTFTVNLNADK